jgi:hypothetical protein
MPFSDFELRAPASEDDPRTLSIPRRQDAGGDAYQHLVDGLARAMRWRRHSLSIGEDFSYVTMVPSRWAGWLTEQQASGPASLPGTELQAELADDVEPGGYFLKRLIESRPAVVLVFSQNTANAFIGELRGRFSAGSPRVGDTVSELLDRDVRLRYAVLADQTFLEARVIFAPHPAGDPQAWGESQPRVLARLVAAARAGALRYDPTTKHLARTARSCSLCAPPRADEPLDRHDLGTPAAPTERATASTPDRQTQSRLLGMLMRPRGQRGRS